MPELESRLFRRHSQNLGVWLNSLTAPESLWRIGLRVGSAVVILTAWQYMAVRSGGFSLPTLTDVVAAWVELTQSKKLLSALIESNFVLVIGFGLAVVIGLPSGVLLGQFEKADALLGLYLDMLLATPKIAIAPIILLGLGLGNPAKIMVVVLFSVVYVAAGARAGLRTINHTLVEMARSFGASELNILTRIRLPAAIPGIMAGIKLGLAQAVIGMVVVELWLPIAGLGGLIVQYKAAFKSGHVYALVVTLVLEGVLIVSASDRLETRFLRWRGLQSAAPIDR